MPYHKYPFSELHPEVYDECLRLKNWVFFWMDDQLVHDNQMDPSFAGSIPLTIPADKRTLLAEGKAQFRVTTQYIDNLKFRAEGDTRPPQTLIVTGHYEEPDESNP